MGRKGGRIPINTCSYSTTCIITKCTVKCMGHHGLSKKPFSVYEYFPPALDIALSVVSMELLSPYKMIEIGPGT